MSWEFSTIELEDNRYSLEPPSNAHKTSLTAQSTISLSIQCYWIKKKQGNARLTIALHCLRIVIGKEKSFEELHCGTPPSSVASYCCVKRSKREKTRPNTSHVYLLIALDLFPITICRWNDSGNVNEWDSRPYESWMVSGRHGQQGQNSPEFEGDIGSWNFIQYLSLDPVHQRHISQYLRLRQSHPRSSWPYCYSYHCITNASKYPYHLLTDEYLSYFNQSTLVQQWRTCWIDFKFWRSYL